VAPVANVLGRVPLIPLFLAGNSSPTIPHKFNKLKGSGFPMGSADTADADGRRGSNVYEVSTWLWLFACGKPRLGGLSVEETALKKKTGREDQAKRSVETHRLEIIIAYLLQWSCMLLLFALEVLPGCMRNHHVLFLVHTSTYQYVLEMNSCNPSRIYQYIK
jgi:hypothetical protein